MKQIVIIMNIMQNTPVASIFSDFPCVTCVRDLGRLPLQTRWVWKDFTPQEGKLDYAEQLLFYNRNKVYVKTDFAHSHVIQLNFVI